MENQHQHVEKVAGMEAKVDMLLEEFRELKTALNTNYIPRTELNERFKAQGERISKIEANQTWIGRLVIGWIITGVLGAVFAASILIQ